jgi:DNA polymerase-3 subunit epsilon
MPYLIFDLEMTGTESDYHDIIQIGAVLVDEQWNKVSEFESLVYPDNPETISKYSEEIHGISLSDLEDAPSAYDVFEDFENWIRKNLKRKQNENIYDVILCGQSVINDINFLKFKYSELNIPWPFSSKLIDLLTITFVFYKIFDSNGINRPKSMSLKSVAQMFQIERDGNNHNALEDANITYSCLMEYIKLSKQVKLTI